MIPALPKLFETPARIRLLKMFVLNPDESYTAPAVAAAALIPRSRIIRELSALVRVGMVKRSSKKREALWQLDPKAPHIRSLQDFLSAATIPNDSFILTQVRKAAVPKLILVAGAFADDWNARIDLLIVADAPKQRELERAIRSIEAELGREVRYVALPTHDFSYRMSVNDRLVRDLFDYPHRILVDRIGGYA